MLKVLVIVPSPKSQNRLVIVPVEVSVKETVSGLRPTVGMELKGATGTNAPVPVTGFVLLPSSPLVKTTRLAKLAALVGAKPTTTLVEPKPAKLNGVPDKTVKGPALMETTPLLRAAPPTLATVKVA